MGKTIKTDDFEQFVTDHGVCYTFKTSKIDGKVSSPGNTPVIKIVGVLWKEKVCDMQSIFTILSSLKTFYNF